MGLWPGEYPLHGLKASAPVTQNNIFLLLENMWFWEKNPTISHSHVLGDTATWMVKGAGLE